MIREAVRVLPEGILVRGRPLPAGIRRIRCLSIGKAATPMARALEQTLGSRLADGIALAPHGFGGSTSTVRVLQGGHPFPDADGLDGARQIAAFADGTQDRDLVFVLLSGGGSALLAAPPPTVSLSDLAETNRLLHACGAPIDAINTVRRHLSTLAGGQLQRHLAPATTITLILSDVVGDRPRDDRLRADGSRPDVLRRCTRRARPLSPMEERPGRRARSSHRRPLRIGRRDDEAGRPGVRCLDGSRPCDESHCLGSGRRCGLPRGLAHCALRGADRRGKRRPSAARWRNRLSPRNAQSLVRRSWWEAARRR